MKGLQKLGITDTDKIIEIIKTSGNANKTITDTIKGMSITEFEELTKGMSQENKDKLYEYIGMNRKTVEKNISVLRSKVSMPEELVKESVTIGEVSRTNDINSLATNIDKRVETASYKKVTVDEYLAMSEQERAKYGKDQGRIDRRIEELVSGEEEILRGYIVGEMSLKDMLEAEAEKKIDDILDKTDMDKYYKNTKKYYESMTAEDFMKATQVLKKDGRVDVTETTKKRRGILGEEGYKTFITNYNNLSRKARFGEGIKGVRVEVLKENSSAVYKAVEAVAGKGKLRIEDAAKVEIIKEEPKEEAKVEAPKGKQEAETPVVAQAEEKVKAMDCVEVATETMGKIIPLKPLTEAALRANPYAQDKLKAAGVGDALKGTELGELRKNTGLHYATMKERTIDLTKVDSKGISEETPLILYMKDQGHALVVTEISDGLVMYTRVDSNSKETEEIKTIDEFVEEEGTQGIILSQLTTPFVAYMEKDGSETGHVVTVTEMKDGYMTYTGTDKDGKKIVETIPIEEFFKEDGFSGLILTPKGEKEVTYLDSGVKEVIGEMFKNTRSKKYESGKEMLGKIIDGVTAPGELNKALKYVLSIWNKDAASMLEYIGLDDGSLGNKEAIIQGATRKITEAVALGKEGKLSDAEVRVEIELVTTLRDLLITVGTDSDWLKNANEEQIMAKLIVSKAVNQNVIVNMFEKGVKASVANASDGDFVIDVKKLQSTIVDKNLKFAKDAKIEDVMDLLAGADKKYITPMMNFSMRNVHAIAAAA